MAILKCLKKGPLNVSNSDPRIKLTKYNDRVIYCGSKDSIDLIQVLIADFYPAPLLSDCLPIQVASGME